MTNTKLALILAAGNGSRMAGRSGELPKPLVNMNGKPLLEHVLLGARAAGIERFIIVIGYRGHAIKQWYESRPIPGIEVTWIANPEYKKDNGISVLRAKKVIRENFLLLMADHLFEPETARSLLSEPFGSEEVILGVDTNICRVFDIDDATKVRLEDGHVMEIGKALRNYNALDTGMFHCSPALFDWLELAAVNGNCSLSDGLRLMVQKGTFKGFDIGAAQWQDCDTPAALDYAQQVIYPQLRASIGIAGEAYA
ncbi:MAG: NTP transferase domain-containing protein [Terracidiphilus sp.]